MFGPIAGIFGRDVEYWIAGDPSILFLFHQEVEVSINQSPGRLKKKEITREPSWYEQRYNYYGDDRQPVGGYQYRR